MCIVHSANLINLALTKKILISNLIKSNHNSFWNYWNSSLVQHKEGLYVKRKERIIIIIVFLSLSRSKLPKTYTIQNSLCWCLESYLEHDSLCIFMKSMKISSKSDKLKSISQSGLDFIQFFNKFLKAMGLRVLPRQNKQKNLKKKNKKLSLCYMSLTLAKLHS